MGQSLEPGYDLIITNGDAAGGLLRKIFTNTEVMPWRDVLHEGPVPETDSHEELSEYRADYLADRGWGTPETLREGFQARDRGLANNEIFENVILWFEHDLYDQLQLLQILNWFSAHPRENGSLQLVQTDDFLGHQDEESLKSWADKAVSVTTGQLELAEKAWTAFLQPTPNDWRALLDENTGDLPFLGQSVRRMLQELPAVKTGLNRTQLQALVAINDGAENLAVLFGEVQQMEDAAFMGDWSFWSILDELATEPGELVAPLKERFSTLMDDDEFKSYLESPLRLTELGQKVLAGLEDYTHHAGINFWLGGTHVTNDTLWRWDDGDNALVAPA